MEVMIHFAFTLVKISILSCAYATLLLAIFILFGRFQPNGWFDRASRNKGWFWFRSGLLISVGLFFFVFTYWGNHGFGDGPRVPIGNGLIVDNTNWTEYGYINEIQTSDGHDLEMTKFRVRDDKLVGNLDSWFDTYANAYFIYDMEDEVMIEFRTQDEFEAYAFAHGLPKSAELRTFAENYYDRWGGWWFWLLP